MAGKTIAQLKKEFVVESSVSVRKVFENVQEMWTFWSENLNVRSPGGFSFEYKSQKFRRGLEIKKQKSRSGDHAEIVSKVICRRFATLCEKKDKRESSAKSEKELDIMSSPIGKSNF